MLRKGSLAAPINVLVSDSLILIFQIFTCIHAWYRKWSTVTWPARQTLILLKFNTWVEVTRSFKVTYHEVPDKNSNNHRALHKWIPLPPTLARTYRQASPGQTRGSPRSLVWLPQREAVPRFSLGVRARCCQCESESPTSQRLMNHYDFVQPLLKWLWQR